MFLQGSDRNTRNPINRAGGSETAAHPVQCIDDYLGAGAVFEVQVAWGSGVVEPFADFFEGKGSATFLKIGNLRNSEAGHD